MNSDCKHLKMICLIVEYSRPDAALHADI